METCAVLFYTIFAGRRGVKHSKNKNLGAERTAITKRKEYFYEKRRTEGKRHRGCGHRFYP